MLLLLKDKSFYFQTMAKIGNNLAFGFLKGLFVFVLFFSASDFLSSCTPVCDYPSTRFAKIRPVNAMPDQDKITIWLNGKAFEKDYPYSMPDNFGYFSQYTDGTPLPTGTIRVTVTADAAGKDTLIADTSMIFDLHKQSLIVIGRAHAFASEPNTKKILLLNDELVQPDPTGTLVRFEHAIPDLPALDIYFVPLPLADTARPNATVQYGKINDYILIRSLRAFTVTEAGNRNNVIVSLSVPAIFDRFVFTTLIRGRSKPLGLEHVASTVILSDIAPGYLNNLQTFGVRLMNATRGRDKISLLIQAAQFGDTMRSNYPRQKETVLDVPKDTLLDYLALRPEINANTGSTNATTYFFSTDYPTIAELADTLDHFRQTAAPDERYTFVAIDTILNSAHAIGKLDHLILRDTISPPTDPTFNRVRIIHVNPDHPTSLLVKVGNITRSMGFKGVIYIDVPVGSQTLELNDGTANKTIPITVSSGRPISIYLLPDTDAGIYPVKIFTE